jgi:ABC-type branched-subunit amino acid transport system substrate-binding protein
MIFWFRRLRLAAVPWLSALALFIAGCDTSRTGAELQDTGAPAPQQAPSAQPDPAALLRAAGTIDLVGGQATQPDGPAGAAGEDAGGEHVERIAILLPLTGSLAYLGKPMLNAAQLAVFDAAGPQFELMVFDTAGEPEQASEAAREAVDQGARLIIGPLLSESTRAATPWAEAAGVPMLSLSSDRTVAGNGVFVLGFTPGDQVDRVVQYASGRGISEFAVIAPQTPYGNLVVQAVQNAVNRYGGQVADIRFVGHDLSGLTFASEAVGANPSEAVGADPSIVSPGETRRALLIAEGGERLRSVADLLPAEGGAPGRVQLLGTGTWDEPWISGEPALIGGWFAAPPPEARSRFVQNYAEAYGETPPRLAGLAYDATALAAAVSRIIGGLDLTPDVLTTPAGFIGSEGIFRLTSSGVAERGLAVLEVTPQGVNVISDAPQSFVGI